MIAYYLSENEARDVATMMSTNHAPKVAATLLAAYSYVWTRADRLARIKAEESACEIIARALALVAKDFWELTDTGCLPLVFIRAISSRASL